MRLGLYLAVFLYLAYPNAAISAEMSVLPRVKLQTLDKATARTQTFEARVGTTMKFGPLYIKVRSCQKSSPIDQPESAGFVQIWEIAPDEKAEWVFSGWMFASSPALSPMDHPIYDVWLIDCLPEEGQEPAPAPVVEAEKPKPQTPAVEEDPDAAPLD